MPERSGFSPVVIALYLSIAGAAFSVPVKTTSPPAKGPVSAKAPLPAKPVPPLEQARLHAAYKESEFDLVALELEKYARTWQNRAWLREDSIFLFKHLAVIYTASPETREKGKYNMIAMLRIMPSAEILDMYVSEEVDRIFIRTRQEFMANMRMFGVDTAGIRIPENRPGKTGNSAAEQVTKDAAGGKASNGWKVAAWTTAGLTAAAAGTVAYFMLAEPEKTEKFNTIEIPKKQD